MGYAEQKEVRTYRIGYHNRVYREVEEYPEGEQYVTYHEVDLDEETNLQVVCALHFERLRGDVPYGGEFYYANWWFAREGAPVADNDALPVIGWSRLDEVTAMLDNLSGEIRHAKI